MSVNCSSGGCSESDLQSLRAALELASTNPDSVDWDIWYNVDRNTDDAATATRRNEVPRMIDQADEVNLAEFRHCASGKCTKPELSDLKTRLKTAALPGYIWSLLGLIGKFNFGYRFKYDFNGSESELP